MSCTVDADLAALETVTRNLAGSMRSIRSEQWSLATPCSDWDLAALTDHITGGNRFTVAVLTGEPAEEAMATTMARFADGSATGPAAIRSLGDQDAAFRRPEVLNRTWSHVVGDLSGRRILRLRLHDLIVHSWDVEEALRPGATLPDDLVHWGLDELLSDDSSTARHFRLVERPAVRSRDDGWASYLEVFGR